MAGVTVSLGESSAQSGPEEEKKEGDQRGYEQRDDLVLASVVLPVGERLGWAGLAGGIVPQQDGNPESGLPCSSPDLS